jgi:ATP-dependent DNA helicase RecQ
MEDDRDDKFWNSVIRHSLVAGLLTKDIENYGLLKVSKEGKKFLNKPYSIMITRDHDFEAEAEEEDDLSLAGSAQRGAGADEALFAMLKDQVKKIARQNNLPPYVIFQETSLAEMAIQYPINMEEMARITGVGMGKAQRYGKTFIEMIKKHVEQNEIERPQDMVVKSVVNKSGLKVHIIQSIDRKLSLEDIGDAKGLKLKDVINEIESIVHSGTRVNINYYINEVVDEEKQDEMMEYFKESETDSVEAALKELGEDLYTEEEVRLMRIKFISEYGN